MVRKNVFISQSIREQFPEAWIRAGHPLDAATSLGLAPCDARVIAQQLASDPEIIEAKTALLAKFGLEYFLPTKIEFAQELLVQARRAKDEPSKLAFYRYYGMLRGYEDESLTANAGKSVNIVVRRSTVPMRTIEATKIN